MDQGLESPGGHSKIDHTANTIRFALSHILDIPEHEIQTSSRFDTIIDPPIRRKVWDALRALDIPLPSLQLPTFVFLAIAIVVVAPIGIFAFLISWSFLISIAEVSILARWLTRPWAVRPPQGCKTIREAAIEITSFRLEDYHAGLWPREAISAKIRHQIAAVANVPFDAVKEDTNLVDLLGC